LTAQGLKGRLLQSFTARISSRWNGNVTVEDARGTQSPAAAHRERLAKRFRSNIENGSFRRGFAMSFVDDNNPYRASAWGDVAANATVDARTEFIRKTYAHLLGAIFAFALIETVLLNTVADQVAPLMLSGGRFGWLVVLGAFMIVSWIADRWAHSATSKNMQYAGLSLYVVAEAVIFVPLLWIANHFFPGHNIIATAGIITLILFGGLTAVVFMTKSDFSWLRGVLCVAGIAAFGVILCSAIFGFSLGILFTSLMIAFAAGWILYDTSNVLHHYNTEQYVAASLALFASVALLFWYVIQFVMQYAGDD
jgi:FtsH-binding integral membrane protein